MTSFPSLGGYTGEIRLNQVTKFKTIDNSRSLCEIYWEFAEKQ